MNFFPVLTIAIARSETMRKTLIGHHIVTQKHTPNNARTNAPTGREAADKSAAKKAEETASSTIAYFGDEELPTPKEAITTYLIQQRANPKGTPSELSQEELLDMVAGARQLREWLNEFELVAGRAARAQGASVRDLATTAGISHRNAHTRYKQIPGEGLTRFGQ